MNTKHTLLCILLWGALIGSAQAQGTMKIEVIGSEDSSPEREVPTITNESLERDDDGAPVELGPGEVYFKFDEADLTTEYEDVERAVGRVDPGRQDADGSPCPRTGSVHPPVALAHPSGRRGAAHPRGGGAVRGGGL